MKNRGIRISFHFIIAFVIIITLIAVFVSCSLFDKDEDNGKSDVDNAAGTEPGGEEEEESKPRYETLKNPFAAKAALEEAGYTVYLRTEGLGDDYEAQLSATKVDGENYDMISIVYCTSDEIAEANLADAKEAIENAGDEAEGYTAGRSGTVVWMGTDAAIKAANGEAPPADSSNDDSPADSGDIDNDGWTGSDNGHADESQIDDNGWTKP